jgi:hypothetical protein
MVRIEFQAVVAAKQSTLPALAMIARVVEKRTVKANDGTWAPERDARTKYRAKNGHCGKEGGDGGAGAENVYGCVEGAVGVSA